MTLSPLMPAIAMYLIYDPHDILQMLTWNILLLYGSLFCSTYVTNNRKYIYAVTALVNSWNYLIMIYSKQSNSTVLSLVLVTLAAAGLVYLYYHIQIIIHLIQKQHQLEVYKHATLIHTTAMENIAHALSTSLTFVANNITPLWHSTHESKVDKASESDISISANSNSSANNKTSKLSVNTPCANPACHCKDCSCNPCKCAPPADTPNNSLSTSILSMNSNGSNNSLNDIPTLKVQFLNKMDPVSNGKSI